MAPTTKVAPAPKQERAKDTVSAVLKATNAALKKGGEASVRIQDISAVTKVSIGSIYHHFGDRDGLIRAAYVDNYSAAISDDIERVRRFMQSMNSANDIQENYEEMAAFITEHFVKFPAREQAFVIGSTAGRPLLREAIIKVQNELTNGLTEVMQLLKDRGILKPGLEPRAAAVFVLGMLHGRIIAEFDRTPVSDKDWNFAMLTAFNGLFATS